jgi:acyl carrier protein
MQISTAKVYETVSTVLGLGGQELSPESSPENISQWVSEATIEILVSIEDYVDIQFTASEISDMRSIGEILSILDGRGLLQS